MRVRVFRKFAKTSLVVLMLSALGLCLISFAQQFYVFVLSREFPPPASLPFLQGGIDILNVDNEQSIPAWFSSSLLLLCSVLLAAITIAVKESRGRYVLSWGALSIIFALLSVDETMAMHERLIGPLRSLLGIGGFFQYAWVIPAGAFVIVFALTYLRFLFDLPMGVRQLFVAAGVLYVSGALGLEMLGGYWAEIHGETNQSYHANLTYHTLVTVEEFLEMTGAVLFLYALMRYTDQLAAFVQDVET